MAALWRSRGKAVHRSKHAAECALTAHDRALLYLTHHATHMDSAAFDLGLSVSFLPF